ncbi:MAG: hypothetical protein Kow0077_22370 [Anaerolineae bacterium]
MRMHFLPDTPVQAEGEDVLQFGAFAEQVCAAIQSTRPPFVFGVLGDWGTGKTSVLRLVEMRCQAQADYIPIWFDAWRYENEDNILYPLLHAIRQRHEQVPGAGSHGFTRAFVEAAVTSALVLTDLGLRGATRALMGQSYKLEEVGDWLSRVRENKEAVAAALEGWTDEVGKLQEAFDALLQAFAADVRPDAPEAVRFVFLIDDLDRCLPDTTIKLLESIKNHLSVPNAIFVLALNAAVVYKGIRHKYGGVEVSGREYLEKILNFTFYVPEPAPERVKAFAEAQIQQILPEEADRERLAEPLRQFGIVLETCHFSNPRKIKRILNRYLLFLDRPEQDRARFHLPSAIRLLVLAEYFPAVFQILRDFIQDKSPTETFEPEQFKAYYHDQTGDHLFNRFPQMAIMHRLLELRERTNKDARLLREHVAEVYRLTRFI